MKKYAGREDYTQEELNMIAGCGFDDLQKQTIENTKQTIENTQALRRIEDKLTSLGRIAFTLEKICGHLYDLNKSNEGIYKEIMAIDLAILKEQAQQKQNELSAFLLRKENEAKAKMAMQHDSNKDPQQSHNSPDQGNNGAQDE